MAAALACQLDARLKACLNEDGAISNLPFERNQMGQTMSQPFMYLTRPYNRPVDSDSLIHELKTTREELKTLLDFIQFRPDSLLRDVGSGAWRVSIRLPGMSHMGFSDEPLILAAEEPEKMRLALRALEITNRSTLAFFDYALRGQGVSSLGASHIADSAAVSVERFAPRHRRSKPLTSKFLPLAY
ncbi:MAG: hypothetical protein ABJF01_23135 [bacterium]